jgi:heme/copper-type cytochrome/quinol oxidase subunit 4
MKLFINIIAFWILMTYSISIGDPIAIVLCLIGFLVMLVFIEEMEESSNNSQETIWQSKEEIQPTPTSRLKKGRSKAG